MARTERKSYVPSSPPTVERSASKVRHGKTTRCPCETKSKPWQERTVAGINFNTEDLPTSFLYVEASQPTPVMVSRPTVTPLVVSPPTVTLPKDATNSKRCWATLFVSTTRKISLAYLRLLSVLTEDVGGNLRA